MRREVGLVQARSQVGPVLESEYTAQRSNAIATDPSIRIQQSSYIISLSPTGTLLVGAGQLQEVGSGAG